MYEKHIFPDGTKIFNRFLNEYVPESNEYFQAWINETRLVYTYETQQQEVRVITIDPETEEEITITELRDVVVTYPVMVTDDEGNVVQETRKIHSLPEIMMFLAGSQTPIPSVESRLTAVEMYLLEKEMTLI